MDHYIYAEIELPTLLPLTEEEVETTELDGCVKDYLAEWRDVVKVK